MSESIGRCRVSFVEMIVWDSNCLIGIYRKHHLHKHAGLSVIAARGAATPPGSMRFWDRIRGCRRCAPRPPANRFDPSGVGNASLTVWDMHATGGKTHTVGKTSLPVDSACRGWSQFETLGLACFKLRRINQTGMRTMEPATTHGLKATPARINALPKPNKLCSDV